MKHFLSWLLISLVALCSPALSIGHAQDDLTSAEYARQLASSDPTVRQSGAEGLARLVALDQKKLVEGYLLVEKDKRVKLALSWALYRMGKSEQLFQIVRDLDSGRHDQAVGYLSQLESPDSLYLFLRQEKTRPKVTIGVLEVLGRIGDNGALQEITPFLGSDDLKVAQAAQSSKESIEQRQGEPQLDSKTRPRTTAKP